MPSSSFPKKMGKLIEINEKLRNLWLDGEL
jgi:hypothetical protein